MYVVNGIQSATEIFLVSLGGGPSLRDLQQQREGRGEKQRASMEPPAEGAGCGESQQQPALRKSSSYPCKRNCYAEGITAG